MGFQDEARRRLQPEIEARRQAELARQREQAQFQSQQRFNERLRGEYAEIAMQEFEEAEVIPLLQEYSARFWSGQGQIQMGDPHVSNSSTDIQAVLSDSYKVQGGGMYHSNPGHWGGPGEQYYEDEPYHDPTYTLTHEKSVSIHFSRDHSGQNYRLWGNERDGELTLAQASLLTLSQVTSQEMEELFVRLATERMRDDLRRGNQYYPKR